MKSMIALIAVVTIALGFVTWWSFVIIAFAAGFAFAGGLTRAPRLERPALATTLGITLGWLVVAVARDIHEDGRISAKLATLLHVQFAPAVYFVVLALVFIPSALAASSGSHAARALRRRR